MGGSCSTSTLLTPCMDLSASSCQQVEPCCLCQGDGVLREADSYRRQGAEDTEEGEVWDRGDTRSDVWSPAESSGKPSSLLARPLAVVWQDEDKGLIGLSSEQGKQARQRKLKVAEAKREESSASATLSTTACTQRTSSQTESTLDETILEAVEETIIYDQSEEEEGRDVPLTHPDPTTTVVCLPPGATSQMCEKPEDSETADAGQGAMQTPAAKSQMVADDSSLITPPNVSRPRRNVAGSADARDLDVPCGSMPVEQPSRPVEIRPTEQPSRASDANRPVETILVEMDKSESDVAAATNDEPSQVLSSGGSDTRDDVPGKAASRYVTKSRCSSRSRRSESTPACVRLRRASTMSGSGREIAGPGVPRRATFHLASPEQPRREAVPAPTCTDEIQSHHSSIDLVRVDSFVGEGSAGETWTDFAARAQASLNAAGIKDEAQLLFEAFRTADDVELIYATFARMFQMATNSKRERTCSMDSTSCMSTQYVAPWSGPGESSSRQWKYPYEPIRVLMGGNWKAKKLWKLLDDRCARAEYEDAPCAGGHLGGKKAVVVGAGPCGLRAAIELRLLGTRVTVVDSRTQFSRINQLHLWSWCGEELKALGARVLEPPPSDFGSNPDLLHVGISELQKLLLKTALLLGVEVLFGTQYVRTEWDTNKSSWSVHLKAASGPCMEGRAGEVVAQMDAAEKMPPSPVAPDCVDHVAVLIAANGFGSTIGPDSGLEVVETESLRRESAVGLICNFQRSNGNEERKLRSYSMAKQFYLPFFKKVATNTGAELENIVYTKGHESHYFVMTPTHKSLVDAGVIIDKSCKPMLERGNIDNGKLDVFVRKIASFQFKTSEPPVLGAALADLGGKGQVAYADSGPRLFDFSKMRRHVDGLTFVRPPANARGEDGCANSLLVTVVGDALIEPFWPEGLGIIRGFFSVMDACSAIAEWGKGADEARVQLHFERAFQQLKTLGAATRSRVLRDDERQYRLAPGTRYRQFHA